MPKNNKRKIEEEKEPFDTDEMGEEKEMKKEKKGEKKEKDEKTLENRNFSDLIKQIQAEYSTSWRYMKPKIDEWAIRLKIYSNMKRDKTAVGDPLLFTVFQTVLASLYTDKLAATFEGREEGDEETASNLGPMSEYDYTQMSKSELDYDWDFNALFYGRALLINMEFSRKLMCPLPEVVDMMTWLRDPRAKSVNGDIRGRGAMRYGGREIALYKNEMKKAGVYFNFKEAKPATGDPFSLVDNSDRARRAAQGFDETDMGQNQVAGDNAEIRALEWFTHYKGKKVLVTLSEKRTSVIRYKVLDDQEVWPIDERVCYKMAHDWDGVSIPDLIEDKQRARSVVQNTALAGVKSGQNPTYIYDSTKIKNRGNLDIDFNKHVPIDGPPSGSVQIVERQQVKSEVDWILNVLDNAAQKATATPDIQQGAGSGGSNTATETNLQASKVDTRYSLTAKLWGWSERSFWQKWYQLYKRHFADLIDEKNIRINGSMGPKWRKLTRENIVSKIDPDIKIESKVVTEAKNVNDLQKYRLFLKDIMATAPDQANTRFALREIGKLSGFKRDMVDQVLPPTMDEMESEEENVQLDNNTKVKVKITDDDFVHMEVHNKAADTPAKYAHIRAHRKAMMLKRSNPELDMARNQPDEAVAEANVGAPLSAGGTPQGAPAPISAPTPL